jgi:L-asparaginase/Glu-tRNA(Gln) amidotransferase subunit D
MEIADWIRIAEEIELNYHLFDAFIVLHGTDTMCYSSSALSFLLEDLGKTVVSIRSYIRAPWSMQCSHMLLHIE